MKSVYSWYLGKVSDSVGKVSDFVGKVSSDIFRRLIEEIGCFRRIARNDCFFMNYYLTNCLNDSLYSESSNIASLLFIVS